MQFYYSHLAFKIANKYDTLVVIIYTVDYMSFRHDSLTWLASMKTVSSCISKVPPTPELIPRKGKGKAECVIGIDFHFLVASLRVILPPAWCSQNQNPPIRTSICAFSLLHIPNHIISNYAHSGTGQPCEQDRRMK